MRLASVSEAKNTLSALLDVVRAGETVVIADRGVPVARLEAVDEAPGADPRLARLERAGLVRRGTGELDVLLDRLGPPPARPKGGGSAAVDALIEERRTGR